MIQLFIYVIFLFAFFGNSLVSYGLIPPQATLVTEAFVYLLFLYSIVFKIRFKTERYSIHLWYPFGLFLIIAFCSIIINNYYNFKPILSLRVILRFYLFYLALINLGLDESLLKKINKLLFILFIIQLPVVAYKFSIYGINELTIGSYAARGGGLTAIIPIVALGYIAGYYFFYKRKTSYVVLAIGFILFGIAGEKRVLLFVYPIVFMGIYFLAYIVGKKERILKHIVVIVCVAALSIAVSAVIIKYHKGFNYYSDGTIDFARAFQYAKKYTTAKHEGASGTVAGGRAAMMQLAVEIAFKYGNFMFGFGPGSLTTSIVDKTADIRLLPIYRSYGQTGFVLILIEYGFLGLIAISLLFIVFAYRCWKWYKIEREPYWRAFAMGSLIFTAYNTLIFFGYSTSPLNSDTITPVYYYAMAAMFVRMKEIAKVKETERLSV